MGTQALRGKGAMRDVYHSLKREPSYHKERNHSLKLQQIEQELVILYRQARDLPPAWLDSWEKQVREQAEKLIDVTRNYVLSDD